MKRDYLRERAMRRGRDGRNPYGRRGGYELSERYRRREHERDRAMGGEYDRREHNGRYDSRYDSNYPSKDYNYYNEQSREYRRPMGYDVYGSMRPRYEDYNMYDGNYDYASEDMEKEWEEDRKEWCEKLKKYDIYGLPKEEIIRLAKQMNAKFEEFDYDEHDFITAYYMVMSDNEVLPTQVTPELYVKMAINFLEDKDAKRQGGEKLCSYYYTEVLGE